MKDDNDWEDIDDDEVEVNLCELVDEMDINNDNNNNENNSN